jgi:hypothetical protein
VLGCERVLMAHKLRGLYPEGLPPLPTPPAGARRPQSL